MVALHLAERKSSRSDSATTASEAGDRARRLKFECLKRVGYQYARPADSLVVNYLKHGSADLQAAKPMLEQFERDEIASVHRLSAQNFWATYHSNFTVDGQKWAADFVQFAEIHYEHLSLRDIDYMAQFMSGHGLSTHDFEPLLERAIQRRAKQIFEKQHADTFTPHEDAVLNQLSPAIHQRLRDQLALLRTQTPWTPIQALEATSSPRKGYNSRDVGSLEKITEAEWAEFLKAETHSELISLLGEFFDRHGRGKRDVADRIMAALEQEIAPRSKFDQIRVGHLKKRYLKAVGEASGATDAASDAG